ncbi:hypothetical protein B0H17DRAFT_1124653 [Mycena rosella]|uniref:Uncharacterized protein n=1 Tax=Mycena rosella TaxID=1033263 RepID=A0AAD7MAY8_MYCRO|nr:hypothetical protein B0H17DRAFT_1124653 [Mycena rosella]
MACDPTVRPILHLRRKGPKSKGFALTHMGQILAGTTLRIRSLRIWRWAGQCGTRTSRWYIQCGSLATISYSTTRGPPTVPSAGLKAWPASEAGTAFLPQWEEARSRPRSTKALLRTERDEIEANTGEDIDARYNNDSAWIVRHLLLVGALFHAVELRAGRWLRTTAHRLRRISRHAVAGRSRPGPRWL